MPPGRGYGNSFVQEAVNRGGHAGCDLSFLTADVGDWPLEWYRRKGYVDVGQMHNFRRVV